MSVDIDVTDVSVSFGDVDVLDGVTTSVDGGQFVGLVGPNGAGKTTLLRSLNGILTPDSGSVEIDGQNVHRMSSRAVSRLVATVPQTTTLSFAFDVRETVAMGRTPHVGRFEGVTERDRRAVQEAMERTEVAAFADRPVTDVSGGERQRVLLARALAQASPVLLLDEPTANLDIHHQVRTLDLVRDLADEGRTVIAAIHDLDLAAQYCDELRLLHGGRIAASGPPEDVLTEANVERAFDTEAVVARHPVTDAESVTALSTPDERPTGRVHVVGGGGTASHYLYTLDAMGYTVSLGVSNEGDTDTGVARRLGCDVVTVPPYAPVDAAARDAVEERIREADAVLVADFEVGEGNLPNLKAALEEPTPVVVEARPFAERNHVGDRAARLYERLCARGTVVAPDDAVDAVRMTVDSDQPIPEGLPTREAGE